MSGLTLPPDSVPDAIERSLALDSTRSFIVQAPAGSGKTGLLIQRYLKLLATVDEPEEIVAITFTRKAAAEMRERVMAALAVAASRRDAAAATESGHERIMRELAEAALHQAACAGWQIADNPLRLRIQTFDSLCASLTRQMPVLSGFGLQAETVEDASGLYLEAARATVKLVEGEEGAALDIERLLEHLDNDVARIEILLVGMLARRDHWLRHVHGKDRDELESALSNLRGEAVRRVHDLYPASLRDELLALARYAAANLAATSHDSSAADYRQLAGLDSLPTGGETGVACWRAIADLLLTREGWRARHTVKEGFPPEPKIRKHFAKPWKDRARELVSLLIEHDDGLLWQALNDLRVLPSPAYSDRQWEVLEAIIRLLPRAVAQLKLVFQSHGKMDFTEVAQGALRALGEPEAPTDLALALDYRIRHLLIDEFQDTSISQYELVSRLIAGWEPGDGRTIFAVGDPMQSIYRFREAEVGLFLRARSIGIGDIALQPISLSANFRSQRGIVDWVNATFAQVMPERENISEGAVPYAKSSSIRNSLPGPAVSIHPFFHNDHAGEANKVVAIALEAQRNSTLSTTAILVRNRSHLHEIVPRLKEADLRFRAIDIEGLGHRPVVQDLLALTRALAHPADRIAWLALLRAPWCGLTLMDMHALADPYVASSAQNGETATVADTANGGSGSPVQPDRPTVWEWINDEARLTRISADGRTRLLRVRPVLQQSIANRCRQSLRAQVEAAWQALGGPACISDRTDFADALAYLDYLEEQEGQGNIFSLAELEKNLDRLFALPDVAADDTIQIMTIHKAKGLEFDCVIVPGLGRTPRRNEKKLFMWMERLREGAGIGDGADLLLAPIQETGGDDDLIYGWLEKLDAEKERLESARLLYVAATRAKKQLHLLGSVRVTEKEGEIELKPPPGKTLLRCLWPLVESVYAHSAAQALPLTGVARADDGTIGDSGASEIDQSLRRLASDWMMPPAPPAVRWNVPSAPRSDHGAIEFSWAGEVARLVGNVVHGWLQRIADDGLAGWDVARIRFLHDTFRRQLVARGITDGGDGVDAAVKRVATALGHAVSDPRGQWLLGPQQDARSELRLTALVEEGYLDIAIDRTFRDASGQRWVVDYKTSSHEGSNMDEFLDREQERYRGQLDRYAALTRAMDGGSVRRGLYFPLLKGWREWGDGD